MRELLWLTPLEALAVVLATAGMYVAMVVLVRVLGQRMMAGMSSFDLAAVIAFGAVIGRAALGEVPRLGGGLVALGTLVILQATAGLLRSLPFGKRLVTNHPILLMADGAIDEQLLRRSHVTPAELQGALRRAGIRHHDEVAAAVHEPTGQISVLRRGQPIDPLLLSGVVGASKVPDGLLAD